ncbi:MAG: aspartate carbamoyltransferase regulatory subunit [Desulfomonile tiedjei]|nr:aspartate carbamoyltransferase regulatory subunit [Desulfomonile tiedjei]
MIDRRVTIAKIQQGIVIDHIPAGKANLIAQVLGLNAMARETGDIIAIGVNFDSPSMQKKDIIKVENLLFTRDMLNVVSLIAPNATIARINNGEVIEKHKVEIPASVGDIVTCPDRFCITNHEEVPGKFIVVERDPVTLRCHYCETEFFGPLIRYKEKT